MKVLHPALHYPPIIGGMEQWIKNISERQPEDTEVFIITGGVKGVAKKERIKNCFILRDSFIKLNSLHSSPFYIIGAIPFIFFNSFYIAVKHKVDIFHCHGFIGSIIGYFLSRVTRVPFISTEQGLVDANKGLLFSTTNFLRGIVYRKASICIASSEAVANDFRKLGVKNIEIIPNGVDLEAFANKRDYSIQKDAFTILSVGRLEKVKGHKYLIEAFKDIKARIPKAQLLVVGDGSERENLEAQVEELDLSESVKFTGAVKHEDLPDIFAKANIFVMPSLFEGFGITAIEAMASGLPLVASKAGSLIEVVEDGRNGMLIGAEDSEAITQAVLFIYDNPHEAQRLSKNGVERAKEYSWDSVSQTIANIYKANI